MDLKATLSASGEMTGEISLLSGGKTPVKGVDYFTEADIDEVINKTLAKTDTKYVARVTGKGLSSNDYTSAEKAEVAKIKDKVGFTDYADIGTAGVIKMLAPPQSGLSISDGVISLVVSSQVDIDNREYVSVITPANLDYAVRSVRPEVILDETNQNITVNCVVNNIYSYAANLGVLSLNITLPATGQYGDFIQVDFYSTSETPTTLTITSNAGLDGFDLVPEEECVYSLYFDWGVSYGESGYGWRFGYSEYPYEEV